MKKCNCNKITIGELLLLMVAGFITGSGAFLLITILVDWSLR